MIESGACHILFEWSSIFWRNFQFVVNISQHFDLGNITAQPKLKLRSYQSRGKLG